MNNEVEKLIRDPHRLGWFLGYDKLSEIHTYWIKKYWLTDYLLMAHRNSYKTTSVIILGYLWYSLLYPDHPVLLIREEMTNAMKTVGAISEHLKKDEMKFIYEEVHGIKDFQLIKDNKNSIVLPTKKKVTVEGSLDCIGIGGSLTGSHYKKIAGDDIVTIKDRISPANREKKILFVSELLNIKTEDGSISVSGTPWHKHDALTHLEENQVLSKVEKFPIKSIEIKGLNDEKLKKIKRGLTPAMYAANYLMQHVAEENQVFSNIQYDNWVPGAPIGYLDPAYSGKNTTALAIGVVQNGLVHVKGWVWPEDVTKRYKDIVEMLKKYFVGSLYVEKNADKGFTVRDLRSFHPSVTERWEGSNKHNRILSYARKNIDYIRFCYDCDPLFITQIVDYEEGKEPDDAPDALAGLIRELGFDCLSDPGRETVATGEVYDKFVV